VKPGDRVRIASSPKSNKDSCEHVGKEGTYVGIWTMHGKERPDVAYPMLVDVDGVGERCFARDEVYAQGDKTNA
jgi:hypothetical protein